MSADTLVLLEGYSVHPAAELFPLIEGDEFNNLVESIRKHGVQTPIVYRGTVLLDGRNRLRAVQRLAEQGVQLDPPTVQRDGDGADDIEWIETQNLARRHLSDDAQVMIAAELWRLISERSLAAQKASQFNTDTAKAAAKKKSAAAVTTKSSSPQKRDRRADDARSTVGQIAAKAKKSMHKARQAVAIQKAVEAGELPADIKTEVIADKKKLKDVTPKKSASNTGSKAKAGPARLIVIEQEIQTASLKAWQRLKDRFPSDEHPLLRKTFAAIIRDEQKELDKK